MYGKYRAEGAFIESHKLKLVALLTDILRTSYSYHADVTNGEYGFFQARSSLPDTLQIAGVVNETGPGAYRASPRRPSSAGVFFVRAGHLTFLLDLTRNVYKPFS